jgi:hypothetical protein
MYEYDPESRSFKRRFTVEERSGQPEARPVTAVNADPASQDIPIDPVLTQFEHGEDPGPDWPRRIFWMVFVLLVLVWLIVLCWLFQRRASEETQSKPSGFLQIEKMFKTDGYIDEQLKPQ